MTDNAQESTSAGPRFGHGFADVIGQWPWEETMARFSGFTDADVRAGCWQRRVEMSSSCLPTTLWS